MRVFFVLALTLCFAALPVWAQTQTDTTQAQTTTVSPVFSGGTGNSTGNAFYGVVDRAHNQLNLVNQLVDDGFRIVDVSATNRAAGGNSDGTVSSAEQGAGFPNVLQFEIFSNAGLNSGKKVVLVVTAGGNGGEGTRHVQPAGEPEAKPPRSGRPVPIATVEGSACTLGPCQDLQTYNMVDPSTGNTQPYRFFYAVKFTPGQRIRVGIYPRDACAAYVAQGGGEASGCTGQELETPTPGRVGQLSLSFALMAAASEVGAPTEAEFETATPMALHFQVDNPEMACPGLSAGQTIYFPGDGLIELDTIGFNLTAGGNLAPADAVVVVAKKLTSPADPSVADTSAAFRTANSIPPVRVPIGQVRQQVAGFENTTTGTDNSYDVSFLVRDAAGMLAAPEGSSCHIHGVVTAPIDGFLQQNNCFIATAAFGSQDAAPVVMLRQFRDQVLSRFQIGKRFVRWYYQWSPQAASWLRENPAFRLPVLVVLTPFQLIAWLSLHPLALSVPMGALVLLIAYLAFRSRRMGGPAC